MLNTYTPHVNSAIAEMLLRYKEPHSLYDPVNYLFAGGGKRLRGALVLMACRCVSEDYMHALPASAAVELLHGFTLMHDDIMDSSPMRRGRQTVHKKWDVNTAILSGDVMMGMAYSELVRCIHHTTDAAAAFEVITWGLTEVCEGQAMDMDLATNNDSTVADYFKMIEKKTARLLEVSCTLGAMLGSGNEQQINALKGFGRNVGIAFQMQDDVLDLTANQEFGKLKGGDIVEGKQTWMMLQLRDRQPESPLVKEFFANNGLPHSEVEAVLDLMRSTGVLDEAQTVVQSYTDLALQCLSNDLLQEGIIELRSLAEQLIERKR